MTRTTEKIICDRCGSEIISGRTIYSGLYASIMHVKKYPNGKYPAAIVGRVAVPHDYDLCEKCTRELTEWLGGENGG